MIDQMRTELVELKLENLTINIKRRLLIEDGDRGHGWYLALALLILVLIPLSLWHILPVTILHNVIFDNQEITFIPVPDIAFFICLPLFLQDSILV